MRMDLNEVGDEEPGHVEVVDGHVPEDATRGGNLLLR